MSGLDHDRYRNKTISFRVSPEEDQLIQARFKVSGLGKAAFIRRSILDCNINITAGRYQSDRLSLEVKRLRDELSRLPLSETNSVENLLNEIQALLKVLQSVIDSN